MPNKHSNPVLKAIVIATSVAAPLTLGVVLGTMSYGADTTSAGATSSDTTRSDDKSPKQESSENTGQTRTGGAGRVPYVPSFERLSSDKNGPIKMVVPSDKPGGGSSGEHQSQPAHPFEPTFIVQRDIVYVPGGKNSQSLDVTLPNKQTGGKKFPVVVWIHGGGWQAGDKHGGPVLALVSRGIACVSINYRLSGEATWPAQIHDCKAAIRWLRAHGSEFNIDTTKIGVWGASAGGHLVALLGAGNGVKTLEGNEGNLDQSSDVQAVCDFFGPSDLPAILEKGDTHPMLMKFLGSSDKQVAKEASPITYVTSKAPPFLIIHGEKDGLVPVKQSEELADELKKAGTKVTLKVVRGAGHGTGFGRTEYDAAVDFFQEQLR